MLPPGQRVMNNTSVRNPAQMAVHQHSIFEPGGATKFMRLRYV